MKPKTPAVVLFAALLLLPGWSAAQDSGSDAADEQQAEEREQTQKLRRAQEALEASRVESARKLEAALARQAEIRRLEEVRAGLARRESYLGHEIYWSQRERDSLQWKDPTDLSSMSRRSTLDHQLNRYQSELERTGTLNQSVTTQLRSLQAR
ncbi:MAG TPA: hypothetical protein VGP71_14905 [Burkholderiales bacterium]|jgi:hypothetical protein|nr:hypothetical protein [Burkholderiales bacterium]